MAATVLTTQRSTANILQTRRTVDVQRDIEIINPSDIPFVQLLRMLRKRPVDDSRVRWVEDEYLPQKSLIVTDNSATTDTIVVTASEGPFFNDGDIITNTITGEYMRVTSVAGDTLSLTRGYGTTSESVGGVGDELINLGPSIAEGQPAPPVRSTLAVEKFNFIQTFRMSYELTSELGEVNLLTEEDLQYQRRKKLQEHLIRIEKSLFFGERAEDTSTASSPQRSFGGARFFITNEDSGGGTLTKTVWETFLKNGFLKGSGEKWFFGSPTVIQAINGFAGDVLRSRTEDTQFGIKTTQYVTAHGTVRLIMHRLFSESTEFEKLGFLIDPNLVWLRMMRDTHRRENIQNPDTLTQKEEYVTKLSVEFRNEAAHRILTNVTA